VRIDEAKRALAAGSLDTDQRATLNFALAKVLEEDGDFDAAFSCFQASNDLRTGTDRYRSEQFSASVDRKITIFSEELFAAKAQIGSASEGLVFVVGMPRSGTTLVEQILASHPQVYGHGELTYLDRLPRSLPERLGGREPYPECVTALDAATVRDIAQEHIARLQRDGSDAVWNVDKLPQNFENLGLITLLFPRARVIHCTRDPLDTCLSCYCQDFGPRHAFTRNLEDLGRYFRDYQRLMTHWYATLPIPLLNVPYEELVGAQDVWSRRLIDFLDLPWDERCLRFYETKRPVLTASVWQVRQPIYASSIGRWRHYAAHLGPLFRGLGIAPPLG
jgi:hypothetical protein